MKGIARIVEALLFTADGPLKVEQVLELLPETDGAAVEEAFTELRDLYDDTSRAFCLVPIAGGYQLLTRPDAAPWVEKFLVGRRRKRLSRAALEVLAVVSYRQPMTRGEVETIRGVDCGGVFRTLLERRLVAVKGRAKTVGHPLLYVTTDRFLEHFGIEKLSDLPKIQEFEALVDREETREELQNAGVLAENAAPAVDARDHGQPESGGEVIA